MSYIFESYQNIYTSEYLKTIVNLTSTPKWEGAVQACDGLRISSPYCLIEKNSDCMWHSKANEYGWLIFDFPMKLLTITGYKIYTPIDCNALRNHYLKGSNNGIDWEEITYINSNTPLENRGKWVKYNVNESTFRMFKIEEEHSASGSESVDKSFGMIKVDFLTTKIIETNIRKETITCKCSSSKTYQYLFMISTHSITNS